MYGCSKWEEDEWVAVAGMGTDGLNWQRGIASYQAEVSSQLFSWLRVISTFTLFYCYPGLFYQIPNLRSRVPILFFSAISAQEAHINKMLLHSCHLCPTTNLTVAECPVAAGAVNAFLALN